MGKNVSKVNCEENTVNRERLKMSSNGFANREGKTYVVLGTQWGDEGKGKIVDLLAERVDIVCRCQVWS